MSNLGWLWLNNTEMNTGTAAIPGKLAVSNYLLMLGQTDAEKLQAAELCIHDVLTAANGNANIAVVCPAHLIISWYASLLWDMGVEFKTFGVYEKSLNHFSNTTSNFCLISEDRLSVLSENADIVWDLMIIDMLDSDVKEYINTIKSSAKKLLITAPATDRLGKDYEKASNLVKAVLHRKKKEKNNEITFDESRVIKDCNKSGEYLLKTITYKVPDTVTKGAGRVVDADSDIPLYKYGGNIFEEYEIEERKTYLSKTYTDEQLGILVAADPKLAAFLNEIDEILRDPKHMVAVYCTAQSTKNYVNKVLAVKNISVCDDAADGFGAGEPRVIVADDMAGNKFLGAARITHIINYEYPENPAILEQRYNRGGRNQALSDSPVFYIFCDDDNKFDGRMLRKTVLSNIDKAFNANVAVRSLLWGIENIEEHLIVLILDLKFMSDYATEEAVEGFRIEYCASEATDAASAADIARKRLEKLVEMFGQHHVLETKEVDGERLFTELAGKIAMFAGKKLYLDKKAGGMLVVDDEAVTAAETAGKPAQATDAQEFVNILTGAPSDYELIKSEVDGIHDNLKLSALINIWKYYRNELKHAGTYKEFMEQYNDHSKGVI